MTYEESGQIIQANASLFPQEYSFLGEADMKNQQMFFFKAFANVPFVDVRDAFVECTKHCNKPIKICDIYVRLSQMKSESNAIYKKLEAEG